ncbi:MAG TPA: Smr/MutS family protein [Thermoanaerobaculia bacterium]|nr:Smr/MutS family protein [Thermoanaerobaculia bacterium]
MSEDGGRGPEGPPVPIPIEEVLDLHPFRPGETAAVVADYVEAAAAKGLSEVRLVHGRGTGLQRAIVRAALSRSPHVLSFADAPPDRGGWGATVAVLAPAGAGVDPSGEG